MKPPGTAIDPRNGRRAELGVVAGGKFDHPDAATLRPESIALWDAYWADAVAHVQTPVDRGVLTRWITEYDRYLRTSAEADKSPTVTGSTGQQVENPLYKIAYRALEAAERCERQLGVGGLNRSALGISVITERKSLQEMNAAYGGGSADGQPTAPTRADPRVINGTAT